MILISNDFCHKIKMYNCDPYNVLLAIATNIPVLPLTASVLQGHIYKKKTNLHGFKHIEKTSKNHQFGKESTSNCCQSK